MPLCCRSYIRSKGVFAISDVLVDYLEIYNRYPSNDFLSKAQRKARHHELMMWEKQKYTAMPTIEEIKTFMRKNDALKYEQPFFLKVVVPCVQRDISEDNIQSLRFLFECNGMEDYRIGTDRDYVYLFCLGTNFKYNAWNLADMVLSKEPDNEIVMYYKYRSIKRVLEYSIHEVPLGVLAGIDGAKKEDIPDMIKNLREFATLSKKLNKNDNHLIKECDTMYTAWEQYLSNIKNYNSFEDYLTKHDIAY